MKSNSKCNLTQLKATYFTSFTIYQNVLTSLDFLNWRGVRNIRKCLGPIEQHDHDRGQEPLLSTMLKYFPKNSMLMRHMRNRQLSFGKLSSMILVRNITNPCCPTIFKLHMTKTQDISGTAFGKLSIMIYNKCQMVCKLRVRLRALMMGTSMIMTKMTMIILMMTTMMMMTRIYKCVSSHARW